MSTEDYVPMCVSPPRWEHSAYITNLGGEDYRLLFWSDTDVGFEHRCDRGERGVIVCAPRLVDHQISDRNTPTVTPSIHCPDCGTHGFITHGRWADA
jgi:hypothetical protein